MKILVTGAAGFLGSAVVERLLAHGYQDIRCFIRPGPKGAPRPRIWRSAPRLLRCPVLGKAWGIRLQPAPGFSPATGGAPLRSRWRFEIPGLGQVAYNIELRILNTQGGGT